MPSAKGATLGDFFSKKKVKKKQKPEDEEEKGPEAEETINVADVAPTDEVETKIEEAVAEKVQEIENEMSTAAPADGSPPNGKSEADIAHRIDPANQEQALEEQDEEEEEEEKLAEKAPQAEPDPLEENIIKEYPPPDRKERRIDPEDGLAYLFDEFVPVNYDKGFELVEIVAYWFDEMSVAEDPVLPNTAVLEDEQAAQQVGLGLDFVVNHREAVEIYTMVPGGAAQPRLLRSMPPVQSADALVWSVNGRFLGVLVQQSVLVLEVASDYGLLCELLPQAGERSQGVKAFHFSPAGGYAVIYEPTEKGDGNVDSEVNLRVWQLDAEPIQTCAFYLDRRAETAWPALKWTPDEYWCCRIIKDGVQVLGGEPLGSAATSGTITCEGVNAFEVSPTNEGSDNSSAYVALFVPNYKGNPARCLVYSLDNLLEPTATQEVAQAHNADIRWNHTGTAVLFLTSTDVDDTGNSYYGNTMLYFVCADGSYSREVATSDVHDVEWSPVADEFLLLSGSLPSQMTLHGGCKADQQMWFGEDYRNKVQWGPFGRFFAFGGFKTLKGDIDFWDRSSGYLLGRTQYECCVDCQWSPDGRLLLGSTTAPRMRVDNRIELFDYVGNRLSKIPFKELYSASWRPMPGCFEDRPETPGRSKLTDRDLVDQPSTPSHAPNSFADRLRAEKQSRARTKAMTTAEQEAELALERKERLEREEREKIADQRSRKTAAIAKEPTPQEFREVVIPEELVARVIGPKGAQIKELKKETNFNLELIKDAATGENRLVIGPAHPWDDLDKAVATIHNHLDDLRTKQDGKGKGSRKGDKGDKGGKGSIREVWIPGDCVGGIIGAKGSTIEEIRKKAGGPNGVNLWVLPKRDGEEERRIQIGPADLEILDRAEELIQAKLEELRNADPEINGGKDGGKQGKGGKSGSKEGKDGKGGERGENGWPEKGRGGGKDTGRKGGWEKGSDSWKSGRRDSYDEDSRSYPKSQGFQLDEASFGPSLADAMRKGSKENMVVEARRQPDTKAEGPWSDDRAKSRMESAWAEDKSKGKSDASWTEDKSKGKSDASWTEAHATKTSWADESAQEGTWAEWSEDVAEWEEENKGRHDSSWAEEKPKARSEGKWVEDKSRSRDARWSEDKSRGRTDGSWADKSRGDGSWMEDKSRGRGESSWKDSKVKGRGDNSWADDRGKGRGDNSWSDDRGKNRGDGGWSEDRGKGRAETSWSDDKSRGRGDNSWTEEKAKGRGQSDRDRGKGKSESANGWSSSKWGSGDRQDWSHEQEVPSQSKRGGGNRSEGNRSERVQDQHSSSASGGGRAASGSATSASAATAENARDAAFAAFRDGDLQNAKQLFDKALRQFSRDEHLLVGRSEVLLLLNDPGKSLMDANTAKRINPKFQAAWLRKAKAEEVLGRTQDAETSYREAQRLEATSPAKAAAPATNEAERMYVCGECGQSPERGAIDEEDGNWYCQACWEALIPAEQDEEEAGQEEQAQESPPAPAPTHGSRGASQPNSRQAQAPGRQRPHERHQASEKAQAPEKAQTSDRQQAASERPQAADVRTSFMPKNPFGAARPTKT